MVGYDVGAIPTLRPAGCPPAALIQNSWGIGWGLSGFFWMAINVLDALDTDLKIVHSGGPWHPSIPKSGFWHDLVHGIGNAIGEAKFGD